MIPALLKELPQPPQPLHRLDEAAHLERYPIMEAQPLNVTGSYYETKIQSLLCQIDGLRAIHQLSFYSPDEYGKRGYVPDVVVCHADRVPRDDITFAMEELGPPYMVVEVVSKTKRDWRRDLVQKRKEYPAWGVPIYLCIDPYNDEWHLFYPHASVSPISADGQVVVINDDLSMSWDGTVSGLRFYWQGEKVLLNSEIAQLEASRADSEYRGRMHADIRAAKEVANRNKADQLAREEAAERKKADIRAAREAAERKKADIRAQKAELRANIAEKDNQKLLAQFMELEEKIKQMGQ